VRDAWTTRLRGSVRLRRECIAAEPEHFVKPARASWAIESSVKRGNRLIRTSQGHPRHDCAALTFSASTTTDEMPAKRVLPPRFCDPAGLLFVQPRGRRWVKPDSGKNRMNKPKMGLSAR